MVLTRWLLSILARLALLASAFQISSVAAAQDFPEVKSLSAIAVEWPSSKVHFEKNADLVRPIASLSKLMAMLVIQEECNLDPNTLHVMTVSNRDAARGGDKTKLTTGWAFSHNDLMHAALMRSDNRALPALAEACGLTPTGLAERMNARALRLGLKYTAFTEPNGLASSNVSTAREMVTVLKEAVSVPALAAIMIKDKAMIQARKGEMVRSVEIKNTDRLISRNDIEVLGGKTGYTDIARYCFAGVAKWVNGAKVSMVFLGAEGRYTRFADFMRIYRWLLGRPSLEGNTVLPAADFRPPLALPGPLQMQ